jgi:hypothetical protein
LCDTFEKNGELNRIEKLKLEKIFEMDNGYVLDFSNRTLNNFIFETNNIELYDDKYSDNGDSKANRLLTIWQKENNYLVGKLTNEMLQYWKDKKRYLTIKLVSENKFYLMSVLR